MMGSSGLDSPGLRNGSYIYFSLKNGAVEIKFVDHSFIADNKNLAMLIGGERSDPLGRCPDLTDDLQEPVPLLQAENAVRRVIATNVDAVKRRPLVAAIDVTTRD